MKKNEAKVFLIIFGIAIMSTIFFLNPHYSIDTVEFLNNGYDTYIQSKFLVDGRIFSVILLRIVINIPMRYVIPILYVIGIFISSIAVMDIRRIIIQYTKTEEKINIIPTIISYVIIFNFMYIDTFQFMEFPIISVSLLLYIKTAKLITEKKSRYILKSFLLALIAIFCYQGTVTVLIVTTFVILIINNKRLNKIVILDMLKLGTIILMTILINYIFTEIVGGTSRIDLNIIKNAKNALINLYMIIFNSNNHYPKYLHLIFITIMVTYCFIKRIKVLNLIWIYSISIGINVILLISTGNGIMNNTAQFGRVFFTIGAVIGYLYMYLWSEGDKIRKDSFMKILLIIYWITILITYFQYTNLYMKGQAIDKYIITNWNKVISKYEEESGNKILKYAYRIDWNNYQRISTETILNKKYDRLSYATILSGRRTNESITQSLFLLYTDRKIDRIPGEENLEEIYFKDTNFSQLKLFDERKFIFIGDTVNIIL